MNAESLYREMQQQAARADVLNDVLRELQFRGVVDTVAIATVRAMRNTAIRRENEARAKYLPIVRAAYAGARS